jgi:branched-chain amino acid transport system permease protein
VDVASFLQQCGIGITSGVFLGLMAVGYTLVYGTVGLIHFAHGDVVMLGGCLALTSLSFLVPLPVVPLTGCVAVILAATCSGLFCGCLNVCIDRFVYRPLRDAPPLSPLVSAIGVSFVLMNVGLVWIGPTDRAFPKIFLGTTRSVGGISILMADLLVLAISVPPLLCLYVLLRQTRFGRSLRSIAAITRATARSGEAGKLIGATFFISGFLGGVASVAAGIHATTINYQMGHQMGLYALTAAVLGGIGSVPGAIVGGLVVGLLRAISVAVLGPRWAMASVFLVLIVFLAFRPQGIYGKSKTRGGQR